MRIFYFILLVSCALNVGAQNEWEEIYTPEGGEIYSLTESPAGFLFADVSGSGIYRSNDNGASWELSFPKGNSWQYGQRLAVTSDGVLFSSSDSILYCSTDNGSSWDEVLSTEGKFSGIVARNDSTDAEVLYVVSGYYMSQMTLHVSYDLGETWIHKQTNIDTEYGDAELAINSQGTFFLETADILYRSADEGETWELTGAGRVLKFMITPADEIVAGYRYDEWLYISGDNGDSWTKLFKGTEIIPLATDNEGLTYASFEGQLISISSDANYWSQFNTLPSGAVTSVLVTLSGDIFVGMDDIYKSSDGGLTWDRSNNGISEDDYNYITTFPNGDLYIYSDSLYSTSDGLSYRTIKDVSNPSNYFTRVFYHPDGDIFAFGGNQYNSPDIVFRSQDNGETFDDVFAIAGYMTNYLNMTPQGTLLLNTDNGTLRSDDKGSTWKLILNVPYAGGAFISPTGTIYFTDSNILYRSEDDGITFEQVPQDIYRRIMTISLQGQLYALDENDYLWVSADEGNTWQQRSGLSQSVYYYPKMVIDAYNNLYVIAMHNGIFRSVDGGLTWQPYNEGAPEGDILNVYDIHVSPDSVIYAAFPGGIWKRSIEDLKKNGEIAQLKTNQLEVFPNPVVVEGNITIRLSDTEPGSISSKPGTNTSQTEILRIYDIKGRATDELPVVSGETQISLSGYKPGVYMIKGLKSGAEGRIVVSSGL